MNHKMWAQWKDFRLNEADDHEGKMAKAQLERSMKYAKMIYNIIDNVDKGKDGGVQFQHGYNPNLLSLWIIYNQYIII